MCVHTSVSINEITHSLTFILLTSHKCVSDATRLGMQLCELLLRALCPYALQPDASPINLLAAQFLSCSESLLAPKPSLLPLADSNWWPTLLTPKTGLK